MMGKLSEEMLGAVMETIPLDIIVIDAQDKVVGWNKPKTADNPQNVLGEDVRKCHPQHVLPIVEQMLSQMKSGERDTATFWHPEEDKGMKLIRYHALRAEDGKYLGCLECDEYIDEIQKISGVKMKLD